MKRAIIAIVVIALVIGAFVAGAVATIYFFINPHMERNYWMERETLEFQVQALDRIAAGSTKEAKDYLWLWSYSTLALLSTDSNFASAVQTRPGLASAVAKLCTKKAR